jgi:hypothetical protein
MAPARGHILPVQEIAAYAEAIRAGIKSRKAVAAELGEDVADIAIENARDAARAKSWASPTPSILEPTGSFLNPRPRARPSRRWSRRTCRSGSIGLRWRREPRVSGHSGPPIIGGQLG